jgi:hypothetical protein
MTNFQLLPKKTIVLRFINICPELQKVWDDHLEYWGDDERGDYNDLSVLAHFIVDRYKEGNIERFDAIFALIEKILNTGNGKEKELITVGLIEDIQTIASNTPDGYRPLERWLGPTSMKAWANIEKLWEGKSSLMYVVREENKKP